MGWSLVTKFAFGWLSDPAGRGNAGTRGRTRNRHPAAAALSARKLNHQKTGSARREEELGSRPELELGSLRGGIAGFRLGKPGTPVLAASEQR